jgi:hypothetical protein
MPDRQSRQTIGSMSISGANSASAGQCRTQRHAEGGRGEILKVGLRMAFRGLRGITRRPAASPPDVVPWSETRH